MINFTGIDPKETPFYICEAWAFLQPAAARTGHYTEESVRGALLIGEFQLWCAFRGETMVATCLTETARFPAGMRCEVVLCGGTDLHEWLKPCLAVIEAWAKEMGCERMRIEGRPGWERALPDYDKRSVVLVKDLHG